MGRGTPRAASTSGGIITRRPCCPTARYWWPGALKLMEVRILPWQARNSTTRRAGRGVPQAIFPPHGLAYRYLLPNGKVLVAAGSTGINSSPSAELYDPANRELDNHGQPRHRTALRTRRPSAPSQGLVAGGYGACNSAELLIRRAGLGQPPAALLTHVVVIRRRCCLNGKYSSQAETVAAQRGTV